MVKIECFSLNIKDKMRMCISPLLFNIVPGVLAGAIKQEKEIEGLHFGNREVKSSLCTDNMFLNIENPKEFSEKHY